MEIENITGVSFTTWGTSEKEGHLSISDSLLGKIVINDKSVHSVVTEIFTEGASGIGGNKLKGSGFRSSGGNNDGVSKSTSFIEGLYNVGDGGSLLSNSNINAIKLVFNFIVVEGDFLVKDGIDSDGSFSSLSISNDEFSLSSSNRYLFK
jgi:hypothetical protein